MKTKGKDKGKNISISSYIDHVDWSKFNLFMWTFELLIDTKRHIREVLVIIVIPISDENMLFYLTHEGYASMKSYKEVGSSEEGWIYIKKIYFRNINF